MVNVVVSSLTTFIMSCLKLYKGTIEVFNKYRRHCFWRGEDLERKNPPLTAWDLVCRPKDQGGSSILNLQTQNEALLMKNIFKKFYKQGIP